MYQIIVLLIILTVFQSQAQFPLPQVPPDPPRAVVPEQYSSYFGLQPGGNLLGLFQGLFPPANYEIAGNPKYTTSGSGGGIPIGLPGLKINRHRGPAPKSNSSTAGIPNIFPTLPKAPVGGLGSGGVAGAPLPSFLTGNTNSLSSILAGVNQQNSLNAPPQIPGFSTLTENGLPGLSGLNGLSGLSGSGLSSLASSGLSSLPRGFPRPGANALPSGYPRPAQNDNLIGQLLKSIGLSDITPNLDLKAFNQILGLSPQDGNVLSQVLYSALTDNPTQTAGKDPSLSNRANAAVVQQLLTQPSSPLCTPKPKPVKKFDIAAFEGKYYQVLYSPPMSLGPCSMITFSKLSDVGAGGPGTVLNLFEYTTERTASGRPSISSGYAIVRAPGQLIFRTSNNPTDLNVYVLHTGPKDSLGQYEYVILSVNCNYPIYVYARDPVKYKQKYEAEVNSVLEQRGLATSWARLFNVIASVDSNLCTFPPTLFNVQGSI